MVSALTYPLALADFIDTLLIESAKFYDHEPQEVSRTAGGDVLKASLGDTLWRGQIKLWKDEHYDQIAVETMLGLLQRSGTSFLVYDTRRVGPQNDPDGSTFGASTPTVLTLESDNKRLSIQGLPANYVLKRGDYISFQYGSPTQYALHRVVQDVTANGSGSTEPIEVTPFIRSGAAALDPVQLVKPYCKAKLIPDPDYGFGNAGLSEGGTFEFVQVPG